MLDLADKLLNYDFIIRIIDHDYSAYLYNLGSTELWLIKLLAVILLIFIVFRWLGAGAVLAFLLMFLMVYVVFSSHIFEFYEKRGEETKSHYKEIEKYMTEQEPNQAEKKD